MPDLPYPTPAGDPDALIRRALTDLHAARPDAALACLDAALQRRPGDAEAYCLRGDALFHRRRVREALASYAQALRCGLDPGRAVPERWMGRMLLGEFEEAWAISDAVLRRRAPGDFNRKDRPFHLRHVWDGSPLAGQAVLVRCYHGLGDTIQFIRYAPLLKRHAGSVIVQAQPELLPLLAPVPGIDRLIPLDDWAPDPPFAVDIEAMELPHALRTTLATIPADIPYLRIDPARVAARRRRLDGADGLKVGLVWAAGTWDERRSVPLAQFARLDAIPGLAPVCLQRGPGLAQRGAAAAGPAFIDDGAPSDSPSDSDDVIETAATILALDLVVTVDTMVAHLAGALGVPVWTLLHFGADWRWLLDREDSPWYPTMRLFRQPAPGDWDTPMEQVAGRLASLAAAAAAGRGGCDASLRA